MVISKTPKANINAPQRTAEGPKANETVNKVAQTADRLNKMLSTLDKKIGSIQQWVDKYSHLNKTKLKQINPKFAANLAKVELNLKYYKQLKAKLEGLNSRFQNLEGMREKKYSEVSLSTLNSINKEIDKSTYYFRREVMRGIAKEVKQFFLDKREGNVAYFKDFFTLMKNNEQRNYDGLTITKQNDSLSLKFKGETIKLSFSVNPKTLEWKVFKDGKALTGSTDNTPKSGVDIAGDYIDTKEASGFPKKLIYYPGNITNRWVKFHEVKNKPADKTPKAEKAQTAKKKAPAKVKVFEDKKKAKVSIKKAPNNKVNTPPTKPQQPKNAEKWKEAVVESSETNKALKKWGENLSRNILQAANAVYGRITAVKQFLGASKEKNKMQHLTKYKNALTEVGKEIKSTNGTDIIKAANKLVDVYKLIPAGLSPEWKEKFKIQLTAPPANKAKVALLPSLLQQPQEIKKTPNRAVANKPKGEPKATPKKKEAPKDKIAAKESTEKSLGLSEWVSQNEKNLRSIRKEFIIHNDLGFYKMYGKYSENVLTRLNTLNRALKNPKLSFTKAVGICKSLRRGFRDMQKRAKKEKIKFVGKDIKKDISKMATLEFPPAPKNPTVAERQLIKAEEKRVAEIKKFTKDIAV